MQARALANVRSRYIMYLCTRGVDRTDAINCIILRTKQIGTLQELGQGIESIREETTTSGVF
ncbi:MAG: hypothetical protein WAM27_08525 [Nitrososphaeraceae archaeon]